MMIRMIHIPATISWMRLKCCISDAKLRIVMVIVPMTISIHSTTIWDKARSHLLVSTAKMLLRLRMAMVTVLMLSTTVVLMIDAIGSPLMEAIGSSLMEAIGGSLMEATIVLISHMIGGMEIPLGGSGNLSWRMIWLSDATLSIGTALILVERPRLGIERLRRGDYLNACSLRTNICTELTDRIMQLFVIRAQILKLKCDGAIGGSSRCIVGILLNGQFDVIQLELIRDGIMEI
jgi:hypothetical protein